jgi:hypothetical protein
MDYEFKTTFWQDFTIADAFGKSAILETYNRAFNEWKTDHIYLTELVLVLNWKLWQHYELKHDEIAKAYNELWQKTEDYAYKNLKGSELDYFIRTID